MNKVVNITHYPKKQVEDILMGAPMPTEDNPTLLYTGAKLYLYKGQLLVMGYAYDNSDVTRAVRVASLPY